MFCRVDDVRLQYDDPKETTDMYLPIFQAGIQVTFCIFSTDSNQARSASDEQDSDESDVVTQYVYGSKAPNLARTRVTAL